MTPHVSALDELERLEKAATPGPWEDDSENGRVLGDLVDPEQPKRGREVVHHGGSVANRQFIAAARNALPDLLKIARAVADTSPFTLSHNGRWLTCIYCQRRWEGAQVEFPHDDGCAHRLAVRSRTP